MDDMNMNSFNNIQNRPEYKKPNSMATASQVCGIIAIVSIFTMTIYPAMILGSMSIILAILSRGKEKEYVDRAKTGLVTGTVAILADIALVAVTVFLIFSNGEFKQLLNQTCEEVYGQTFDDMMEDAMNGENPLQNYSSIPKM